MNKTIKKSPLLLITLLLGLSLTSCHDDDDDAAKDTQIEADFIGKAVGNFSAEEWYPGGKLGTTENVSAGCYEDETPAVNQMNLLEAFNKGEAFFERNYNTGTPPFNGLGPAAVRKSCLDCHPAYGHGKRVDRYTASWGNGSCSSSIIRWMAPTATTVPISAR